MVVQLNIPYETLLNLVDQLPDEQQKSLLEHLMKRADQQALSPDEKLALYHASIKTNPINEAPSIRREDWYDDDGR